MTAPTPVREAFQFGVFELDVRHAELRKQGMRVKIQEQPFRILQFLLEHRGQIVTREELRVHIWPANTFVEFDHGLYSAMARLRDALGDSPESPRFIETVARRGYRFIAPVDVLPSRAYEAQSGTTPAPWLKERRQLRLIASVFGGLLAGTILIALFLGLNVGGWRTGHLRSPFPQPRALDYRRITNDGLDKLGNPSLGHIPSAFVTDGTRLYFTEASSDHYVLAAVPIGGGETVQLPTAFPNVDLGDISPSGAELLAFSYSGTTAQSPLWIVPTLGGAPRRVGDITAQDAAWSRDGLRIVYANGHELLSCNPDGTEIQKIVTVPGLPVWPRWSPTADVIRFTQYDPERLSAALWEVSVDGKHLGPLARHEGASDCCGVWTKDGRYFVFESNRGSAGTSIWLIREQRDWLGRMDREPVQLTAGPLSFSTPVLSDNGKKLIAVGVDERGELLRYDPNSQHMVPYLGGPSAEVSLHNRRAEWVTIPDLSLWTSKGDGSERVRLTFAPVRVSSPRWSPDGKQIVFMAMRKQGEPLRVCLISSQGGKVEELVDGQDNQAYPDWSPDGESVIFGGLPAVFTGRSEETSIHVFNRRNHQLSRLLGSEGLFFPRWSPDGRYLAAKTVDSKKLMLFDFTTQKWETLNSGSIGSLNWSEDGQHLFFDSLFGRDLIISRLRVRDRRIERVAVLTDFQRALGSPLPWMGLSEDGSPLLLRGIGSQEIYSISLQLP